MFSKERRLEFIPIHGIPKVNIGDDVAQLVIESCERTSVGPQENDIFVVTQKIISKSEGRIRQLSSLKPGMRARYFGMRTGKDPRFVQLVLDESTNVIRARKGTLIVEHKIGFICANAGIDHSNVGTSNEKPEEAYLLLPENPDLSAQRIRTRLESHYKKSFAVLIIDSHGRAWRNGALGMTIGLSGLPGLVDLRGKEDLFGYKLRITTIGASDGLAAAASIVMGEASEGIPCVIARGFPYELRESNIKELIRPKSRDLFR